MLIIVKWAPIVSHYIQASFKAIQSKYILCPIIDFGPEKVPLFFPIPWNHSSFPNIARKLTSEQMRGQNSVDLISSESQTVALDLVKPKIRIICTECQILN